MAGDNEGANRKRRKLEKQDAIRKRKELSKKAVKGPNPTPGTKAWAKKRGLDK